MEGPEERVIRYERDGSVTLIQGEEQRTIAAGASVAQVDAGAAAFFAEGDDQGA